jgi:hypothetical protein
MSGVAALDASKPATARPERADVPSSALGFPPLSRPEGAITEGSADIL